MARVRPMEGYRPAYEGMYAVTARVVNPLLTAAVELDDLHRRGELTVVRVCDAMAEAGAAVDEFLAWTATEFDESTKDLKEKAER